MTQPGRVVVWSERAAVRQWAKTASPDSPPIVVTNLTEIRDGDTIITDVEHAGENVTLEVPHLLLIWGEQANVQLLQTTLAMGADAFVLPSTRTLKPMLARRKPVRDRQALRTPISIMGRSPQMEQVVELIQRTSLSSAPVLITGETGTGKELVARAIHRLSPRRTEPFLAVNCAALPDTLFESELFGHERGSFTGADSQRRGRFELAGSGSLMLDEIGEMPFSLQVKLLRVLQERSYERVGGNKTLAVECRILAATNRQLRSEVSGGAFRRDLFYRLNVLSIHLQPLRERRGDLLELWQYMLERVAQQEELPCPKTPVETTRVLLGHDWPGNIRELENVVYHAVTLCQGTRVLPEHLPHYLRVAQTASQQPTVVGRTLQDIEKVAILSTHEAVQNVKKTAEILGMSMRKVQYRLKDYREANPPSAAPGATPGVRAPRVVIAEDSNDVRWGLTQFLQDLGYDVVGVADGGALLEHLGSAMLLEGRNSPPDAIITDVRMPGLSGLQLLESVRARGWRVPVIVITAFGDPETRKAAEDLGASWFIDKPFEFETLQQALKQALKKPWEEVALS